MSSELIHMLEVTEFPKSTKERVSPNRQALFRSVYITITLVPLVNPNHITKLRENMRRLFNGINVGRQQSNMNSGGQSTT